MSTTPPADRAGRLPPIARPDPLYHAVLLGLSSAVLVAAIVLAIRGQTQVVLPLLQWPLPELCLLRRATGLGCPGCGLTRSFISLAHGDLPAAWSYNPAGPWLFAILAFQLPYRSCQLWRIRRGQGEIRMLRIAQLALGAFVILLLGQWALRLGGWS